MLKFFISRGLSSIDLDYSKIATSFTATLISYSVGVCATLFFKNLLDLRMLCCLLLVLALASVKQVLYVPLLVLLLGFSWATYQFDLFFETQLPSEYEGQTLLVSGSINGLVESTTQSSRFHFKVSSATSLTGLDIPQLARQTVIISCYRCNLQFMPDQQWLLSVRLKRPHSYSSWGAFDYEKYLFRHKVIATGYIRAKQPNTHLPDLASRYKSPLNQWRWQIRDNLIQKLSGDKNQIGRAIIAALIIGDKSFFNNQQKQVFQITGISHLMAISGLHIGLAFYLCGWILRWGLAPFAYIYNFIPRQKIVLLPSLLVALCYAALAGFAISTQRAMIMLALYVFVRIFAREVSLLKVLMMTIFLILVYDPFSILDVGFWLSCFAVFVIAILNQYQIERQNDVEIVPISLLKLQPVLWASMLPVTLLFFGKVSFLSPFVNLLLVPLFCGFLIPTTLFVLIFDVVGLQKLSDVIILLLSQAYQWIYFCLLWLSEIPFAKLALPPMHLFDWMLFLIVAVAYFKSWYFRHFLAVFFLFLLLGFNNPTKLKSKEFNVVLLDVGQGLAMVVEAQDYVLVYDTGPAYQSGFNTAEAVLIPYLQRQGINTIDTLIISHADNDHIGGLSSLQQAITIKQILTSRVDKIKNASHCQNGQSWSVAGVQFSILSPETTTPQGSNNHSCVLMVSNAAFKVLISGDIEKPVERYLLDNKVLMDADILLVPHQGSKTSSTSEFIDAVNPNLGLIAAGYRNHYGHPHSEVVRRYKERNIKLLSTIESGTILLNINENKWSVNAHRVTAKGFWNHLKKPT